MHYNYVILEFAKDTYCLKSRALGHYHAVEDIKYDPSYGRIGSVSRGSVKFWCVGQNGEYCGHLFSSRLTRLH